jgi:hypothetical protein
MDYVATTMSSFPHSKFCLAAFDMTTFDEPTDFRIHVVQVGCQMNEMPKVTNTVIIHSGTVIPMFPEK